MSSQYPIIADQRATPSEVATITQLQQVINELAARLDAAEARLRAANL